MTTINETESHITASRASHMNHAPIYQLSPEATAADIGNHIDLQLGRVHSMLMALANVGEEELTEDQTKDCLYTCMDMVEEVKDLRRFASGKIR
ncbi:hypothetical protein U5817_06730 [Aromatoleum evansii]|uniref:Uncharacterized protein n=1 Tax=Aromatoleum evansii TaxID=59406 RepID=A0ABZ1AQK6_AROEV|nr:hypothetical protein U5817_06730 [Aromatoleum evansii]